MHVRGHFSSLTVPLPHPPFLFIFTFRFSQPFFSRPRLFHFHFSYLFHFAHTLIFPLHCFFLLRIFAFSDCSCTLFSPRPLARLPRPLRKPPTPPLPPPLVPATLFNTLIRFRTHFVSRHHSLATSPTHAPLSPRMSPIAPCSVFHVLALCKAPQAKRRRQKRP